MTKILSEDSSLPPVTLKFAILLLGVIIGGVSSWFVLRAEIDRVSDRIATIERLGSHGLQDHITGTAREFEQVKVQMEKLSGDLETVRGLLELHMRYDGIEVPKRRAAEAAVRKAASDAKATALIGGE